MTFEMLSAHSFVTTADY